MPTFNVTAPDGTKYTVTGPTEQHALEQVKAQHKPSLTEKLQSLEKPFDDKMRDPDAPWYEKAAAAVPAIPLHIAGGIINSVPQAITAPRRAITGEMSLEQMPGEAANLAGLVTMGARGGSSLLNGVEGDVLGAGVRGSKSKVGAGASNKAAEKEAIQFYASDRSGNEALRTGTIKKKSEPTYSGDEDAEIEDGYYSGGEPDKAVDENQYYSGGEPDVADPTDKNQYYSGGEPDPPSAADANARFLLTEQSKQRAEQLDAVFDKIEPTSKDKTLFRGIDDAKVAGLAKLKPGQTFTDKGFSTATTSERTAHEYAGTAMSTDPVNGPGRVLKIRVPAGSKVLDVAKEVGTGDYVEKGDYFFPRNSTFTVDSVESINGGRIVNATLNPPKVVKSTK